MLNAGVHPIVPEKGSVGASGDLAPLAHLALGMIGEGMVEFENQVIPAMDGLARASLRPLKPEAKEGLSFCQRYTGDGCDWFSRYLACGATLQARRYRRGHDPRGA